MGEYTRPCWWAIALRAIVLSPFALLMIIGKQAEIVADYLSEILPEPVVYLIRKCPVCDGAEGEYTRDTDYKAWRPCSRCDGKGVVKNV